MHYTVSIIRNQLLGLEGDEGSPKKTEHNDCFSCVRGLSMLTDRLDQKTSSPGGVSESSQSGLSLFRPFLFFLFDKNCDMAGVTPLKLWQMLTNKYTHASKSGSSYWCTWYITGSTYPKTCYVAVEDTKHHQPQHNNNTPWIPPIQQQTPGTLKHS